MLLIDSSPEAKKCPVSFSLRRARQLYARRFEKIGMGKSGNSPDCGNNWIRRACKKCPIRRTNWQPGSRVVQCSLRLLSASTAKQRELSMLMKWKSELAELQDRLINNSLAATGDESAVKANSAELKVEAARLAEELDVMGMGHVVNERRKALAIFDWSERAETWLGSNTADRRKMLIAVQSNRQVCDATQATTRRKPFDLLAERLH